MSTYFSKYTGQEVEDLLDKANDLSVPTKVSELDNDAGYITESAIEGKQDKLNYYSENTSAGTAAINAPNGVDINTNYLNIGVSNVGITDYDGYGFSVRGGIARVVGDYLYLMGKGATINNIPIATTEDLESKQDKLQYYSESSDDAQINVPNQINIKAETILASGDYISLSGATRIQTGADDTLMTGNNFAAMANSFQLSDNAGASGIFGSAEQVNLKSTLVTYNGNEIATTEDLEGKQDKLNYYSESTKSKSAFIDSDSIFLTATDKAYYNNKEIATVDMVDTALNTIKAALPSDSLLGYLDSWFASGKDYITSAEIVDYTEDTSMVRIRFTCEGYASEGAYYFVLALEDGGNMPITTEPGNTGTSEGYLVYGVFDIVVKLTYQMGIYGFSVINQKYTLELSDKITDLVSLRKAYPSSTLVSMVGSYWINQLSSHTQSTTIKIMDYDSETNSVRLRFYGRVTSNIQGLAIYESSSAKYLIQYVPRTATNYHVVFDLVVPFVNGEFLPFSTLLHVVDYV